MEKCAIKKLSSLLQPPKILWGKQIRMYCLDTAHWQFVITPQGKVSVSMNADPINEIHTRQK